MLELNFTFTGWDVLLFLVVTFMGTAVAYIHQPRWKALILSLPFPFTVASLSLNGRINATHALGMLVLVLYTHAIRMMHVNARMPIIATIAICTIGYGAVATILAQVVPGSEAAFWIYISAVFVVALVMYLHMDHRDEPGHRTPLPAWVKVPIIAAVIASLVVSKKMLHGFMTTFPMVTIVAAYEARHSLWTISRAIPLFMVCMAPMMVVIHVAQDYVPLAVALAMGWVVYLGLLLPLTRAQWTADRAAVQAAATQNI